ncbi:sugar ABC transporter ATP-binding protein [Atribacter laminatus]|jgi:ABC-type sugar transport system ATPase subunit|uniref:Ribose import ATP-binding protein RbsA n=1 Tax=Atribacter laminatus TaxID=2847778 RepID=A0A7T1F3K8_ATRLM|nr:sugar ABC transporter ATP-binding protein [Atribacter laminatus]QPM68515.1 Ribose import ATP-binding protein RbsA [Atribacter laminatus]
MAYLLELKGITKKFPGVVALQDVDYSLQKGEIHALVGENGAGKSTLIKIITGALQPDVGSLFWIGQPVSLDYPWQARQIGIAFIHQNRSLIPFFSGFENIYLGRPYPRKRTGLVYWKKMREEVNAVISQYHLSVNLDKPIQELPAGQQTMVEIVRTLLDKTNLIVLDEPTATLTNAETQLLFQAIRTLKEQGVAFVYVSHRIDEIFEIADFVTVLRNGKVVKTLPIHEAKKSDIISLMAGETVISTFPPPPPIEFSQTVLSVQSLTVTRKQMKNINFSLRKGEILGIFGLIGAGQSELIETLFGMHHPFSGTILVDSEKVNIKNSRSAIQNGILLVPGDRLLQGLIFPFNVRENITLPMLYRFRKNRYFPIPNRRKEMKLAKEMITNLNIRTSGVEQNVATLSGGNQQKVVLSKWIGYGAKVLLCNEPTCGVDVVSRREIYRFLYDLARKGTGIIVCSADIEEVLAISHRIGVMSQREFVGIFPNENITKTEILSLCCLRNGTE